MAPTTAVEISKKERKEKKDKREKKKSKKSKTESSPAAAAAAAADEPTTTDEAPKPSKESRKRKRTALPEDGELEVDITAPEPLSKREQRLAKKGKLDPNTKASKAPRPVAASDSDDSDNEGGEKAATPKDKAADKKPEKSPHGVWIGNLPWSATRESLRDFFTKHAGIEDTRITRVHMPAPDKAAVANMRIKPHNKGFAYVDFDGPGAVEAAIDASETLMGGRPVLIKNASNFDGRPKRKEGDGEGEGGLTKFSKTAAAQAGGGKEPSKRVFVGNLSFEVTKVDLVEHYGKCGEVVDVHVATFQDTGKCKGFAWVTFETIDAAAAAVAGYTMIPADDDDSDEEMEDADKADGAEKKKRRKKARKWFVNRFGGRDLRVEFAEDASTRYKKRFGKDKESGNAGADGEEFGEVHPSRQRQMGKGRREPRKVDARTIAPGAALAHAPRSTGAIVESKGKKITFDT